MLRLSTLLVVLLAAMCLGIKVPKGEPKLKMGTLLSPDYDDAAVAERMKSLKKGDPRSPWELSGLREGDIIDPIGSGRNVIIDPKWNWPNNTVVWKYEPGMLRNEKIQIQQGMGIISNGTCIKFRKATAKDKDYIYIMHTAAGCNSFIGKQNGSQVVHLARDSCMQYAVVAHELLHAIGLDHQHNVFNRDDYVTINLTNVNKDSWHNFDKDSKTEYTDYGLPYDYHSVMHYNKFSFSKYDPIDYSWGPEYWSIVPHPDETIEIGQQRYVSQIDYLKVNLKYKCPGYEGPTIVIDQSTWQARPMNLG